MSNYSVITNFAGKDSGHSTTLAADIAAELAAIQTAVASKYNFLNIVHETANVPDGQSQYLASDADFLFESGRNGQGAWIWGAGFSDGVVDLGTTTFTGADVNLNINAAQGNFIKLRANWTGHPGNVFILQNPTNGRPGQVLFIEIQNVGSTTPDVAISGALPSNVKGIFTFDNDNPFYNPCGPNTANLYQMICDGTTWFLTMERNQIAYV
jgi:hypothetical protein